MRLLLKAFSNCQWELVQWTDRGGGDVRRASPASRSCGPRATRARTSGWPTWPARWTFLTALYHHVRDRDELLELVAAQVLEETAFDDWIPRDGAPWPDWVRAYALAFRAAMLENAGLLRYVRLTTPPTAGRLEQIDAFVGALLAAGFSTADVMHASSTSTCS